MILLVIEGEGQNMALLLIHRTLVIAGSRAYGEEGLIRLVRPGYKIHLPLAYGLIVYPLPRENKVRGI